MKVIVTGACGFIGFHVSAKLIEDGHHVIAVDNINDYYDQKLKQDRLKILEELSTRTNSFEFHKLDIENMGDLENLFKAAKPKIVIHLAAQAGVRYSIENPHAYVSTNISGFLNILECCRHNGIDHLMYASSSSVYGGNKDMPFSESDAVDHPVSIYAVTKKTNELMAHSYSHLYGIPTTGLRFFTVYGPWGRPDMALFKFTKNILSGEPIEVYNAGNMSRDFTYISDVVRAIVELITKIPSKNEHYGSEEMNAGSSWAPYRIVNVGNSCPSKLIDFIAVLEKALGVKAEKRLLPMQPGDVEGTECDCKKLKELTGFSPGVNIEEGISQFVEWYNMYYDRITVQTGMNDRITAGLA